MKIAGWIFVIFAILNFIAFIIGIANGAPGEWIASRIAFAIVVGAIGGVMIYKGNHKNEDNADDGWSNT